MTMRLASLIRKPDPTAPSKRKRQGPPFSSYAVPKVPPFRESISSQELDSLPAILPKLEVGDVDHPLEREADAIADRVVRMPAPTREAPDNRAPEPDAESDDEVEDSDLSDDPTLGAFAGGGALPGGPGSGTQHECDSEIHRSVVDALVMRECESCEDEDEIRRACASCDAKEDEPIRRERAVSRRAGMTPGRDWLALPKPERVSPLSPVVSTRWFNTRPAPAPSMQEPSASGRGGPTGEAFADRLGARVRSGGRSLPVTARSFLETRLGVGLGDVRIHDDSAADSLAEQINARAFTFRNDIFFRSGELTPSSQAGMRLLAHEVAHTLQNRGIAHELPRAIPSSGRLARDVVRRGPPPTEGDAEADDSRPNAPVLTEIQIGEKEAVFIGLGAGGQVRRVTAKLASRPKGLDEGSYEGTITSRGNFTLDHDFGKIASREFKLTFKNPEEVINSFDWEVSAKLSIKVFGSDGALEFTPEAGPEGDQGSGAFDAGSPVPDLLAIPINEGVLAIIDEDLRENGPIPDDVREFMFSKGAPSLFRWTESNVEHVLRAARLVQQLSEQERANYLARARALPERKRSWSGFADGLEKYADDQLDRTANISSLAHYIKFFDDAPDKAPQWYYNYHPHEGGPGSILAHDFLYDWLNTKPNPLTGPQFADYVADYGKHFRGEAAQIGLTFLDHAEVSVHEQRRRLHDQHVVTELTSLLQSEEMQSHGRLAKQSTKLASEDSSLTGRGSEHFEEKAKKEQDAAREALVAAHPVLADEDFDVVDAIEEQSGTKVAKWAIARLEKRNRQITDLRATFRDDEQILQVLRMDFLLQETFASLGMSESSVAAGMIQKYRDRLADNKMLLDLAITAAEIFAAIVATVAGGPVGTALAFASLGSSAFTASRDIDEYLTQSAAHDLGLAAHSPSAFWVALSVAAVGIDAASVAKAVIGPMRAFDSGLKTFDGDSIEDAAALRKKLETLDGVNAEQAEDLAKLAETRRVARGAAADRMVRLEIDPQKVDDEFLDWLDGLHEDTIKRLEQPGNRWLVDDLVEMKPSVRWILTKCASDCLPDWLKADTFGDFVKRIEALEVGASDSAKRSMRDLFHDIDPADGVAPKQRLAELEAAAEAGDLEATAKQLVLAHKAVPALETSTEKLLELAELLIKDDIKDFHRLVEKAKAEGVIRAGHQLNTTDLELLKDIMIIAEFRYKILKMSDANELIAKTLPLKLRKKNYAGKLQSLDKRVSGLLPEDRRIYAEISRAALGGDQKGLTQNLAKLKHFLDELFQQDTDAVKNAKNLAKQQPKYLSFLTYGGSVTGDTKFIDAQLGIAKVMVENASEMAALGKSAKPSNTTLYKKFWEDLYSNGDDIRMTEATQSEVGSIELLNSSGAQKIDANVRAAPSSRSISSDQYKNVMERFRTYSVGGGDKDRAMVAEALFAKRQSPSDIPTLYTGDEGVYNGVLRMNRATEGGKILEVFGFKLRIELVKA